MIELLVTAPSNTIIMKRYIQVTAGRGPEESCFVVAQVLKKMLKECKANGCYAEVMHREKSHINGNLFSASLVVDTKNNPEILKDWIGTIQWTSESPFRKNQKRKNWFVGVFELDTEMMEEFSWKDVTYDAFRSSGPGGQHVDKTSSAVRALHRPTGIAVTAQDTRSQLQNKKLANERLLRAWQEAEMQRLKSQHAKEWNNHLDLQRGNPVKVFKSVDFKQRQETRKFRHQRTSEKQKWRREI